MSKGIRERRINKAQNEQKEGKNKEERGERKNRKKKKEKKTQEERSMKPRAAFLGKDKLDATLARLIKNKRERTQIK